LHDEFRLTSKNFIAICAAAFFYFGSFQILIPTMPQYVAHLGGSPSQVGLVIGLFTLVAVIVRPYFGKLADRHGRKPFMVGGTAFFFLLPLLYNHLNSVPPLYAARSLHGLAHASFMAAANAYIADLAPPHRRGEVIGIYGTFSVLALAIFPAVGTAIIGRYGNFAYLFAVSATAGLFALLATTVLGETRRSPGAQNPPPRLLEVGRQKGVLIPSLTLFCGALSYGTVITFLPLFAPSRGVTNFGIFFTVYAASTIFSRVVAGRVSDRIPRQKLVPPFMLILLAGVLLLPSLHSMSLLLIIAVLFGLGFGSFMPVLNALVVDLTPPYARGSALAFFTSFMDVGITAGAMVLGPIGDKFGYPAMFYTAAAVVAAGFLVFLLTLKPYQPAK